MIPLLRERWPEIAVTAARSAALCAEQETLLDEIAKTDLLASQHCDGSLQIAQLETMSTARRNQLLRFWLRQQTGTVPSYAQLQKIWPEVALARADAMPELVWQQGVIRRYQHRLYQVFPIPAAIPSQVLPINIPVHLTNGVLTLQTDDLSEVRLRMPEADEKLTIEYNLPGSYKAHPVGREHSRELKKLWQEYGVAPWLRSAMPVICYQGKIAAVVGLFICQDYICQTRDIGLKINWDQNT